jgi:abhydrolase domain-containing protein 17
MGCSVNHLVFQPPPPKKKPPGYMIYLQTSSGNSIPARYFNMGREYTILMSHGNAEDITRVEEWVSKTLVHNVSNANVLVYEYSGYHSQEIQPSEKFVYDDAQAAIHFLIDCIHVPVKKIVLYGRSLGSGPSCYLAQKYQVGGLILQTPLSSIFRVILDFRFTLPGDMFPNIDRMSKITCPLLMIHGTRDEIIPMQHSVDLYKSCSSSKKQEYYVEGAGHNNIEVIAGSKLFENMQSFIESL